MTLGFTNSVPVTLTHFAVWRMGRFKVVKTVANATPDEEKAARSIVERKFKRSVVSLSGTTLSAEEWEEKLSDASASVG